ncbi:hypothetical protein [Pseudophaeobacter sp.]|uniref:hypothetical protein n=1 Tax=Pseudophaeobacter sp. TaxID=1971739 RepID=UPI00326649F9
MPLLNALAFACWAAAAALLVWVYDQANYALLPVVVSLAVSGVFALAFSRMVSLLVEIHAAIQRNGGHLRAMQPDDLKSSTKYRG